MRKYGFWKDLTFYFLVESYADVVLRAASEFQALSENSTESAEKLQAISELRAEADQVNGQFLQRLEQAFITPLDKEDLLEILQDFDAVLGAIEWAARGIQILPAEGSSPQFSALTGKLHEAAQAAFELASSLRHGYKHQALPPNLAALYRIKRESDLLYEDLLKSLITKTHLGPQATLAWKEVFDRVRAVPEKSAVLALLVARLLVKYA